MGGTGESSETAKGEEEKDEEEATKSLKRRETKKTKHSTHHHHQVRPFGEDVEQPREVGVPQRRRGLDLFWNGVEEREKERERKRVSVGSFVLCRRRCRRPPPPRVPLPAREPRRINNRLPPSQRPVLPPPPRREIPFCERTGDWERLSPVLKHGESEARGRQLRNPPSHPPPPTPTKPAASAPAAKGSTSNERKKQKQKN